MPKSANQKRKLLVLYRFLLARTDDDHPVTVQEMQDELTRWDISAERMLHTPTQINCHMVGGGRPEPEGETRWLVHRPAGV